MKSLQNILVEGLLDSNFDINIITLEELLYTVYNKRMTNKQWEEPIKAIDISFEPANSSDCAQDYWGTLEVFPKYREIHIHYKPEGVRARGFGVQMNSMEIKKGKNKCGGDGCHWLLKPAYQIPETKENQRILDKFYRHEYGRGI